jgi:DNA-binding response OmpR family regulator
MLQRVGYDVIVVANGRDALSVVENLKPVDVILLDLMLPYVSGFQIIRELKDNPVWQHVPIIVLSGKVLEQDIVKALDLGANDYVTKPFKPQELLARIRRLMNSSAQLALQP